MEQSNKRRLQLVAVLCFAMAMLFALPKQTAFAASQVSIARIDYSEENIIINNEGNSKIYFATEAEADKGVWEEIAVTNPNGTTEIDFSYLSPTKANILVFAEESEANKKNPVRVIINERAKKLSVTINYERADDLAAGSDIAELVNIQATIGNGNSPIKFADLEWKKGEGGTWYKCTGNTDASKNLTVDKLQRYMIKGTTLYFRIAAIDVTSAAGIDQYGRNNGRRYSDDIKVKITKRPTAPRVVKGIDGSKFTATLKYGQEYRVTSLNGTVVPNPVWVRITDKKVKSMDLTEVVGSGDGYGYTSKFPSVVIEYRDYATSKKAASKISTITMPEQYVPNGVIINGDVPNLIDPAKEDVYVSYSSNKYLVITIPSASTSKPFEYAIMKKGEDYGNAKWSAVTKNTPVKIAATKAKDDYELIVRLKEIKNKEIASTLLKLQGSSTDVRYSISYPKAAASLEATPSPGSAVGTTAIALNPPASGNIYVVEVGAKVTGKTTSDKVGGTVPTYTSGSDINVTAGQYVTIYEINATTRNIVAFKSIEISASHIKN